MKRNRFNANLYTIRPINKSGIWCEENNYLYSNGKYRTKILACELPNWYVYGDIYRTYGYLSAKGVKNLLYEADYTFKNHLHKYDALYISYDQPIKKDNSSTIFKHYTGYDEVITGLFIRRFTEAVEIYSDFNVSKIKSDMQKKLDWFDASRNHI